MAANRANKKRASPCPRLLLIIVHLRYIGCTYLVQTGARVFQPSSAQTRAAVCWGYAAQSIPPTRIRTKGYDTDITENMSHQTSAMEDANVPPLESPELLLPNLNSALRELRGALDLLGDPELIDGITPVMRSLLLAEVLGREWILAIGGSQGAGKTTLLRTIYELSGSDAAWLPPNQGQGEKIPVLILEEPGRTRVEGAVRCLQKESSDYRVRDVVLGIEDFQRILRNPDPSHLLPVLRVPRRYFQHPNQGWLLLPGYEKEDRQNQGWQRLMRQALVGAAGCVIVTDETRMANLQQREIVRDMLSKELKGARTAVVVTKTEAIRTDSDRQSSLRHTARETFELPEEGADGLIICAGSDDPAYVSEWLPRFAAMAQDLAMSGGNARTAQLTRLDSVLRRDLTTVLNRVQARAKLFLQQREGGDGGPREVVNACLAAYDGECANIRDDYQGGITKGLDEILSGARQKIRQRLNSDHEGVWNHVKDYFRSASESLGRIESDVSGAWQSGGSVLAAHAVAIGHITTLKLGAPREMCERGTAAPKPELQFPTLQRLGYHDGHAVVPWSHPTNDELHNLRILLGSTRTSVSGKSNIDFEQSVKLLPVLALEYARLASIMPAVVGVDNDMNADAKMLRPELVGQVFGKLSEGVNIGQTVLRSIAAVLALDVAIDGDVDVVHILSSIFTGNSADTAASGGASGGAGAAAPAAASAAITGFGAAVIGLVAIGYLAHSALQHVRLHDAKAIHAAEGMLRGIRDHHIVHFMNHYDEIMKRFRARLQEALRTRYHLDELLMEKDRFAKAMSDVRALQHDLLYQLGATGQSMSLFSPLAPDA